MMAESGEVQMTGGTAENPLVIKMAPPKASAGLTEDQIERLSIALMSNSIKEIAEAVRSIPPLNTEIRRQNSQAVDTVRKVGRPRKIRGPGGPSADANPDPNKPFVVKKRQPRSEPAEPRRPWKPERLDSTKPILQCDACGYQANRRDYMRRHQIRVHSDYRPYQCTLCDFKTTEKHDLDRHMNSKYHGGKGLSQKRTKLTATVRIKCDQCSYATKSVKSILKHKQLHRAEALDEMSGGGSGLTAEQSEAMDDGDEPEYLEGEGDDTEDQENTVEQGSGDLTDDPVAMLMMNDLMNRTQNQ